MQVGNGGVGDIWHLASAAFEDWTGTQLTHVPFQGAAPAILSLGEAYLDAAPFKASIESDRESLKKVLAKLVIQK